MFLLGVLHADDVAGGLARGLGLVGVLGEACEGSRGGGPVGAGESLVALLLRGGVGFEEFHELRVFGARERLNDGDAEGEGDVGEGEGFVEVEGEEAFVRKGLGA